MFQLRPKASLPLFTGFPWPTKNKLAGWNSLRAATLAQSFGTMYGLRLINNNYVANGTGKARQPVMSDKRCKDVTITYDPNFRGGR